ncbi:MAG: AraC family transcriptional regulator [Pseudomonadota bacterium]
MYWRDHDALAGLHHAGDTYGLVVRPPGGCRITVPAGAHFIDIYLGKSKGSYEIAGLESFGRESPPSTFVFLPANGEREIQATRSGWSVQLSFAKDMITLPNKLLSEPGRLGLRAICHGEDEALIGLAQLLTGVWSDDIPEPEPAHLDAIVLLLITRASHHLLRDDVRFPKTASASKRVQTVLDHVEHNLGEQLSLTDLADIAGVSPYHFARVFRKATGRSPHQYLIERRLARAKQRLKRSDDPIAAIAIDCGFGSQSHMTDVFGKILGTTPGAVRKNTL